MSAKHVLASADCTYMRWPNAEAAKAPERMRRVGASLPICRLLKQSSGATGPNPVAPPPAQWLGR